MPDPVPPDVGPGRSRPDAASLAAGLALAAFGVVLLLATLDVVHLTFAVLAPLVCAVAGVILLVRGLTRGR